MFNRISSSWALVKASAAVLRADKELLIFPIVSFIGVLLVTISFAIPTFMAGILDGVGSLEEFPIAGYVIAFLYYLAQYFVIFFANTALVGATMIRLKGGDPTVSDGFRIAMKHSRSIFGYALISATIGMILRVLSERSGVVGQIAVSLIGLGWNLATFLVVPGLVIEECGPIEAVKRSTELLKKTWGEQVVGNFAVGTIFGLLTFGVILLMLPVLFLAFSTESFVLIALTIGVGIIAVATLSLLNAALSGIYAAALYQYAAEGTTSSYFETPLLVNAFRRK
ncbi:MAG: hypothetical protein H0T73_08570 [Ardenticatenales bacterium]|nr:hypothetical protein [Ardenticatenales bacterium]